MINDDCVDYNRLLYLSTVPVCMEATVTQNGRMVAVVAIIGCDATVFFFSIFGPKLEAKLLEIDSDDVTL